MDPDGHEDVAAVGCNGDQDCLKKLAESRAPASEMAIGAVKGAINGFIGLSNTANFYVDAALSLVTDFQFGQMAPLPMTPTEETGAIIADGLLIAATAGESLLANSGRSTEIVERAMSRLELRATEESGLLRGGRTSGDHFVSDAVNTDPLRARQRLALPQTPEVRVRMEVERGVFPSPERVAPRYGMPGGGAERWIPGTVPVPVRILQIQQYLRKCH